MSSVFPNQAQDSNALDAIKEAIGAKKFISETEVWYHRLPSSWTMQLPVAPAHISNCLAVNRKQMRSVHPPPLSEGHPHASVSVPCRMPYRMRVAASSDAGGVIHHPTASSTHSPLLLHPHPCFRNLHPPPSWRRSRRRAA